MGKLYNSRVRKGWTENYTQVYSDLINKKKSGLSIEARMLLIIVLSFKNGWDIHWDYFEKEQGFAKGRRLKALKELKKKGYCIEHKYKPSKSWQHDYYFFGYQLLKKEREDILQKIKGGTYSEAK